jgi:membrane protease YdiL (CAAX protease family)
VRRWPLSSFFLLTFAITWPAWWLAARAGYGTESSTFAAAIAFYIGVFAPGIVSVILTRAFEGPGALRALLARLVQANVAGRWFAFALFFTISLKLVSAVAHRLLLGVWPVFAEGPLALTVLLMFGATFISTISGGQAGEELGWRGFALPRMAQMMGYRTSGLVLGLVWAAWHIPIFYIFPHADTYQQSFPLYALQVTGLSVAVTFLYVNTRGSLLLVMLMHAAHNNTKDIVRSAPPEPGGVWSLHGSPAWLLSIGLIWVCAAWFLSRMPRAVPDLPTPELIPTR